MILTEGKTRSYMKHGKTPYRPIGPPPAPIKK